MASKKIAVLGDDGTLGGPNGSPLNSAAVIGDHTWASIGAAQGLAATAVKTGAYSAAAGDLVPVDASGGSVTVTLPTAPADRTRIGVKAITAPGANAVTIAAGDADVFNKAGGSTTLTLKALFQGVLLQYKASGAVWYVTTADTPLAVASGAAQLGTDGTVGGPGGSALTGSVVSGAQTNPGNLGAARTIDFASTPNKLVMLSGTLNANLTVTLSNRAGGAQALLLLTQDGTGGRTVTVSDGSATQSVSVAAAAGATTAVLVSCPDATNLVAVPLSTPGPTGATGAAGATWWTGAGAPGTVTGAVTGDYYLRSNGEVYKSTSGNNTWADQGFSLIGPPGGALAQSDYDAIMPWTVQVAGVPALPTTVVKVGTWSAVVSGTGGSYIASDGAQNDSLGWDLPLAAGTWTLGLQCVLFAGGAIYTVAIDGVSVGTIDSYNAATNYNISRTITGIAVATNGKHRLTLTAATRNASNTTSYGLDFYSFQMTRTA